MTKNNQTIGDRVKIARKKSGLSQSDVSNIMCLSKSVCGHWERGFTTPSAIQLVKLAEILNVSFEYLATGSDEKTENIVINDENQEKILTAKMLTIFKQLPLYKKQKLVDFLE